ncbi:hypothetical protein AF335_28950 [Streptomyces eurocidicus]|uniref:Uncharacterized protein n=1 Tax=Streptomyces eurocidicus TaxID=66423 RepID=A0A2N8NNG5_STREU|nr:hypothetical protein [Streptomyces eurocidicus]PNE30313.1 hypothetical protein AF335_28950 [Streptomyces eurocidicus]
MTDVTTVLLMGTAVFRTVDPVIRARIPITCRRCDIGTGLAVGTDGVSTWISCPAGHTTRDWRLSSEAVLEIAAAAGGAPVPAEGEAWFRVPVQTEILPDYEDLL